MQSYDNLLLTVMPAWTPGAHWMFPVAIFHEISDLGQKEA